MSDDLITDQSQIPDMPFYVLMRDTFLSGWGEAEERDSFHIALCESESEAKIVADNAAARADQDSIEILTEKPMIHREARFGLMSRKMSSRWYEAGAFAEQESEGRSPKQTRAKELAAKAG